MKRVLFILLCALVLFAVQSQAQLAKLDLELFGPGSYCSIDLDTSLVCTIKLGQILQVWVRAHGVPAWVPIKLIATWLPDNAAFESVWRQGEAMQVFTFTPNESHVTEPPPYRCVSFPEEPLRVSFIARTDYESISKELKIYVRMNRPPQAETEVVHVNQIVLLSAFASADPDGEVLQYRWDQIGGPSVLLFGEETPYAIFLAPPSPVQLVFRLTVSDGAYSVSKDVVVTVKSGPNVFLAAPGLSTLRFDDPR